PGTRCRTSSATPRAGRPMPCLASPGSCWSCWNASVPATSPSPSARRRTAASATASTRPTRASACRPRTSGDARSPPARRGALGLAVLAHTEYEADDLIGTALHRARPAGFRGVIVSADKDLSQLLGEHDEQWDFARGLRWGAAGVKARHGVHAHQIADYLALTGDAVDNIPGVGGIGAKTAAVLLSHFGSLDALLARVDEVAFLRLRGAAQVAARLREQRELALLFRQL